MEDGPHVMRIEAYDALGVKGIRTIDFTVRNGPGIAVAGIRQHDVLDGKIPVIVNAYGGTSAVNWEPSQAETPAPPPTWAWVMLIVVVAFGLFYGVQQWSPTEGLRATPTYGTFSGLARARWSAAAAAALPAAALARRQARAAFDACVGGPDACGGRAGRGALLRQLRRLPPGRGPGPRRRVPAAGRRSRRQRAPIPPSTSRPSSTASRARPSTASTTPHRCRHSGAS